MSYSVNASGTKNQVKRMITEQGGMYMPAFHASVLYAAIDEVVGDNVTVSAYGHHNFDAGTGNMNFSVFP